MTTSQSADIASTVDQVAGGIARATSILARRHRTSGSATAPGNTPPLLTYGSLLSGLSDLAPTEIRQLFPWSLCSAGAALQQAMTDVLGTLGTHTSGGTVTLVFATPAWHLLIATTNTSLPSAQAGELSASVRPETWRFMSARLCAQPQPNETTFSSVLNAWHVVVRAADDEATSRFLSTVLDLSLTRSIRDSKASQ